MTADPSNNASADLPPKRRPVWVEALRAIAAMFSTLLKIEILVAIGQIFSSIATIFVSFYTYELWKTTNLSVEVARDQADAAKKANDLNLKLSEFLNRPRMMWSKYDVEVGKKGESLFSVKFTIKIKNIGATPAIKMSPYGDQGLLNFENGKVRLPSIYNSGKDEDKSGIVDTVFPGEEHGIFNNEFIFSKQDSDEFYSGEKVFTLWGVIYYTDVFGVDHWTRYCSYFKDDKFHTVMSCSEHNDTD